MIYILMIWTVVAAVGDRHGVNSRSYDWRPLGEFQAEVNGAGLQLGKTAQQMCEDAARQLALKTENYRCVRSK